MRLFKKKKIEAPIIIPTTPEEYVLEIKRRYFFKVWEISRGSWGYEILWADKVGGIHSLLSQVAVSQAEALKKVDILIQERVELSLVRNRYQDAPVVPYVSGP